MRRLVVGISSSDRVLPLMDGAIKPDGFSLAFDSGGIDGIFWRALHSDDFDLSEMSLAAFCVLTSRADRRFVGLPVFTSRLFRHNSVYVRTDSGLTGFSQLAGRRVGLPEFQMTAAVWIRGLMAADHGVELKSIDWFAGGVDRAGRRERIPLHLPEGYRLTHIAEDRTLGDMLLAGEIDALIAAKMPRVFLEQPDRVRRLVVDFRTAEQDWFGRHRMFPIMHLVVMRRKVHDEDPALARAVFDAFEAARKVSMDRLHDTDALTCMLPWLTDEAESTFRLMGRDYWTYGVRANETALSAFLRYLADQGLLARPISVSDLFPPELAQT